jgi:hypothetical protein
LSCRHAWPTALLRMHVCCVCACLCVKVCVFDWLVWAAPVLPLLLCAVADAAAGYPSMEVTSSKMEVDDTYIGRLVGKAGSILSDIMSSTKASIKISQKGEFVQGTNYRIVTVTGYPPNVAMAMQRIQEIVYSAAQQAVVMPH